MSSAARRTACKTDRGENRRTAGASGTAPGTEQWLATRTARINVTRGLLLGHGLTLGLGARAALTRVPAVPEDAEVDLPGLVQHDVAVPLEEVRALETRIARSDEPLAAIAREHPVAQRMQQIPGVGVTDEEMRKGLEVSWRRRTLKAVSGGLNA